MNHVEDINVNITITTNNAKILREQRIDWSLVTVEHGETLLGTSAPTEVQDNSFMYNYSTTLQCSTRDVNKINQIINKPLQLKVTEVTYKKGKEDKQIPLCNCFVDMLEWLLDARLTHTHTYPLNFLQVQQRQALVQPEIEITVTFSNKLLTPNFFLGANIVYITMEACFSLPEQMIANERDNYVTGLTFPLKSDIEEPILFYRGTLQHQPASTVTEKFWYNSAAASQNSPSPLASRNVVTGRYMEDHGDYQDESVFEFRKKSEVSSHILWNTEFRSVMTPAGIAKFMQNVKASPYKPIEFIRISGAQPIAPTSKMKKEESGGQLSFYAMAYMNWAPLVFPGVSNLHGAYSLHPFSKSDIKEKLKRTPPYLDDDDNHGLLIPIIMAGPYGERMQDKTIPEFLESEKLKEKNTYITVNIQFHHPIVPERSLDEIIFRVHEILPQRTSFRPKVDLAAQAIESFGAQVTSIAALLLEDYKTILQKEATTYVGKDRFSSHDYRKNKFLHEIKRSGKFFAAKEQLKYHILRIVREKFLRKAAFDNKQEYQEFLSHLYTYLTEIMHQHLNDFLCMNDLVTYQPPPETVLAKNAPSEAMYLGDLDLAQKYHQQRIVKFAEMVEPWVDYAVYCFYIGNDEKAVECLHEALVNAPDNYNTMLLYGMANDLTGYNATAETFLIAAGTGSPNNPIVFTILGLHYHNVGEVGGATVHFKKAEMFSRSSVEGVQVKSSAGSKSSVVTGSSADTTYSSIYLKAAEFCLTHCVLVYAEKALAMEWTFKSNSLSPQYYCLLAKMHFLKRDYNEAEKTLMQVIETAEADAEMWALHGHVLYALNHRRKAMREYHRAISTVRPPQDLNIVYMKLALIYMGFDEPQNAKRHFLLACKHSPTCLSWLGVGKACYQMDQLIEAEEALSEANIMDNSNAEVWAYLCLVCLKTGQADAAQQCYRFAYKFELKQAELMKDIRQLSDALGIEVKLV